MSCAIAGDILKMKLFICANHFILVDSFVLPCLPANRETRTNAKYGNISSKTDNIHKSTNMKKIIILATVTFISLTTFGQSKPDDLINNFFKEYAKTPAKAVEDIYATNPWTSRIKDGIETMKNEVNKYTVDYVGKYYGYELITKKQFSESFILYSYMVKYDRQPMRFIFKLYKPNDKWTLFSFKIDSDLDDEIEQSAKLYYLNLNKDN